MQHQVGVLAGHHRLEVQLEALLLECLVQQPVPGMMVFANGRGHVVLQARPVRLALAFRLQQCLVGQAQHRLRCIAVDERCQADRRHRWHVSRSGGIQAGQRTVQALRQLLRFFTDQSWRQHGKFAATDPGDQVLGFRVAGTFTR